MGVLLVEEAGGVVTDWWGRGPEVYTRTGALIVANRSTHAHLLEQLAAVPRKGGANPQPRGPSRSNSAHPLSWWRMASSGAASPAGTAFGSLP